MTESPESPFPSQGRLAGIDYGTVRVGIALSNPDQSISVPYELLNRSTPGKEAVYFRQFVAEEKICGFVVGLPLHVSGDESQKSLEAREFGKWLSETTNCPVVFQDERYTTAEAEELLLEAGLTSKKRKQRLDKLAAHLILSMFLNRSDRP